MSIERNPRDADPSGEKKRTLEEGCRAQSGARPTLLRRPARTLWGFVALLLALLVPATVALTLAAAWLLFPGVRGPAAMPPPGRGAAPARDKVQEMAVLAGEWKVTFPNDYVRVYTIELDGKVAHTSGDGKSWKGRITRKDGMLVLYFEGGSAIERLTLGVDGRLLSEYWDPKADFPDKNAHLIGIGVRQK
jgi:hypothetical protein